MPSDPGRGVVAALLIAGLATGIGTAGMPGGARPEGSRAGVEAAVGKLPLYFIENRGQVDPDAAYYAQGRDAAVGFTASGITLSLAGAACSDPAPPSRLTSPQRMAPPGPPPGESPMARPRHTLRLEYVGARPGVKPEGRERTQAHVSYFTGPRAQWKTRLKTFARVEYRDVWPGIDLVYSGTSSRLKYEFVVAPGADPAQIRLAYWGATGVGVDGDGRLEVSTPVGSLCDEKPYVYQQVDGRQVEIPSSYILAPGPAASESPTLSTHRYGFRIGAFDATRPLIVDPAMLLYCGYLGGSGTDSGSSIAVDAAGRVYVTGHTDSTEATFPVTGGPDLASSGSFDAFVARVNAAGTALDYCGYLGGSGLDLGTGIAVDAGGNAYVTGETGSAPVTFPRVGGPDLTYNGGSSDTFVARVNAVGTGLDYCGYIGGSGADSGKGIAVDAAGNAYVTGATSSTEATFPVAGGPDLTYNGGLDDAFIARVNAAGTGLDHCGYLGGSDRDAGTGVAVDGNGGAYLTGRTFSTEGTFPVLRGPDLTHNGGFEDAFVARVNAAGAGLDYCGYLGGSRPDHARGIAVDAGGNAYVTGYTESSEATFPVVGGPDLTHNGGFLDAFVARVNAAGTALDYCGYIGGNGIDSGHAIATDEAGNAYLAGSTASSAATFPVVGGPGLTHGGGLHDAFVARVNAAGTALDYCGYIGGSGYDHGYGIAVATDSSTYVTGETASSESSFPAVRGPDTSFNQGTDAFLAAIREVSSAEVSVRAGDPAAGEVGSDAGAFTVTRTGPTTDPLTVHFAAAGTAASGTDYAALGTSVTIPAGAAEVALAVTAVADTAVEGDETVVLTLASAAGYAVGAPNAAAVTIRDYRGGTLQVKRRLLFGRVRMPGSREKTLVLRNGSSRSLVVTISPPAPAPPFQTGTGTGTVTIPPRGSHVARFRFTPARKGSVSGKATIASTDRSKPTVSVRLSGTGQEPMVSPP